MRPTNRPLPKSGKGRFVGRIWVEDQDYHIVRFNGAYGGYSLTSNYFNFDSWRTSVGKNLWLPAFVYVEQGNVHDPKMTRMAFKPFRAQTRLWGYNLGHAHEEQELSKVLIEAPTAINDLADTGNDYTPIQAEHYWNRQAELNVMDYLERKGLQAPQGERSEEHTSELQSRLHLACRLLLEKNTTIAIHLRRP